MKMKINDGRRNWLLTLAPSIFTSRNNATGVRYDLTIFEQSLDRSGILYEDGHTYTGAKRIAAEDGSILSSYSCISTTAQKAADEMLKKFQSQPIQAPEWNPKERLIED